MKKEKSLLWRILNRIQVYFKLNGGEMGRPAAYLLGLLPFVALLVSSLPLVGLDYPQGHDWTFELVRVAEFKSALLNGQYPPYWGENLYGGFGSPIFIFYAPLFMLVSSLSSFLGSSVATGSIVALLILSLAAVFTIKSALHAITGMKSVLDSAAARISVYFFILNPYLIGDKLLRNANAEYVALCLSPLVMCGLFTVGRKPFLGGLILAIGLALTIISHNLTALIITGALVVGVLVLYLPVPRKNVLVMFAGGVGLGLGMSAFFWVPALLYKSLVQIDQLMVGKFDFHKQFQSISSLFGYDQFYAAGLLVPLVLFGTSLLLFFAYRRRELAERKVEIFALISSLALLFLLTKASVHIWEKVPFLPLFQFPWRLMGPLALFTAMLAGLCFSYLLRGTSVKMVILTELILLALCIANAVPNLQASMPLPEQMTDRLPDILKRESIRTNRLSATVLDEYLPRVANLDVVHMKHQEGPIFHTTPAIEVDVIKDSGVDIVLATNDVKPARMEITRWFFPGWSCRVNGTTEEVGMNQYGLLDISIPSGPNEIIIHLDPPALRRVCLVISITCFSIWCMAVVFLIIRHGLGKLP